MVQGARGEANVGFVVGTERVLAIDSRATPRMARQVIEQIRRVTAKPIRFLVNTHYHGDHTFGNQAFAALSATIVGHELARRRMISYGPQHLQGFFTTRKDLVTDLSEVQLTFPTLTFHERLDIYLDERPIELRYFGLAHTDGDIVVFLPTEGVLFIADLVFGRITPALIDGDARNWIRALNTIAGFGARAIVPGHRRLVTPRDLQEMRQYLVDFVEEVREVVRQGGSEEEAVLHVRLEKYRHWRMRERLPIAVRRTYRQMQGQRSSLGDRRYDDEYPDDTKQALPAMESSRQD